MIPLSINQHKAIDRAKEMLVPAAERLLDATLLCNARPPATRKIHIAKNHFGESQLRNLIAIANKTESPAVVINFIRYQMGRDKKGNGWSKPHDGSTLGDRLIHALEQGIIVAALATVEGHKDKAVAQLVRIQLIRHFLGFASRYFKYLETCHGREANGGRQ